jgi:hypothetical protein
MVGGLDLGAQLADGAAPAPVGALGTAAGPGQS